MKREEIIAALDHLSNKLKVKKTVIDDQKYIVCPVCKYRLPYQYQKVNGMKYCYHCGQRIEVTYDRN